MIETGIERMTEAGIERRLQLSDSESKKE